MWGRSEEHTSELQSQSNLVCRLLLEKKTWISSMVRVARVPPDPFGSVGECGLDLSAAAEDSGIIRFENSKRIGKAEYGCVDGRGVRLNRFQEPATLLVPQMFDDCSLQILSLV